MSKGWAGGSTRAYRKLRAHVLRRDGHTCRMPTHPEVQALATARGIDLTKICTTAATQMHHLDGVKAGKVCPPSRAIASCWPCNRAIGEPTTNPPPTHDTKPTDPTPNPPRTHW